MNRDEVVNTLLDRTSIEPGFTNLGAVNNLPMGYPIMEQPLIPSTGYPQINSMGTISSCHGVNGIPAPENFLHMQQNCAKDQGMDMMVPPKPLKPCDSKNHTTASVLDKKGSDTLFQPAKRFLPAIQEISILLEEIILNNRFCISLHYRKVREEDYGILEEKMKSVVENYAEFHL